MHLAVYPPQGRIRLAVPQKTDEDVLRLFAISKLGWIKKQVRHFQEQARETPRDYVSGESHYYQGKRYLLEVEAHAGYGKVQLSGTKKISLKVPIGAPVEEKARIMKEWYRKQLKIQIQPLLAKWEKVMGVKAAGWGVKQMKTKWGSCNTERKRIWLNLELAKKPVACLEYILVHEMVHLLVRHHNDTFISYMDHYLPNWRQLREELNRLPVSYRD